MRTKSAETIVSEVQIASVVGQGEIEVTLLIGLIALSSLASKIVSSTRPEDYEFWLHRDFAKVVYPILIEGSHADLVVFKAKLPVLKPDAHSIFLDERNRLIAFATSVFCSTGDGVTPEKIEAYLPILRERAKRRANLTKRSNVLGAVGLAPILVVLVCLAANANLSQSSKDNALFGMAAFYFVLFAVGLCWAVIYANRPRNRVGKPESLLVRIGITCPQCGKNFTMRSNTIGDSLMKVGATITRVDYTPLGRVKTKNTYRAGVDDWRKPDWRSSDKVEVAVRHSGIGRRECNSCGYQGSSYQYTYTTNEPL